MWLLYVLDHTHPFSVQILGTTLNQYSLLSLDNQIKEVLPQFHQECIVEERGEYPTLHTLCCRPSLARVYNLPVLLVQKCKCACMYLSESTPTHSHYHQCDWVYDCTYSVDHNMLAGTCWHAFDPYWTLCRDGVLVWHSPLSFYYALLILPSPQKRKVKSLLWNSISSATKISHQTVSHPTNYQDL